MGQEQVLADRYTLVVPLGRGGMGQVWEALDTRLDRKVAVKLLTAGVFAASPDFGLDVRRFTREATVTAGLVHPSVPAIFDAGTYDGGLYLVMELVDGCTIGDLVAEQGPLPVGWAAAIAGPGRRGARHRPSARDPPPGHQAAERHADQGRHREGAGLRRRGHHQPADHQQLA